jgi:hypothetical protein
MVAACVNRPRSKRAEARHRVNLKCLTLSHYPTALQRPNASRNLQSCKEQFAAQGAALMDFVSRPFERER